MKIHTAFTIVMGECVQTYLNSQASKGRRLDGKWVWHVSCMEKKRNY